MDRLMGDPVWLPHPVVYFGRWIGWWEHRLNHGAARMWKGAALAVASICLVLWGSMWLMAALSTYASPVVVTVVQAVLIFYCLAGTTLIREVRWVFQAVDRSLQEGRQQVARIVGRNTENLNRDEIHAAALETLAENLSDGVVAPLFWWALLGVPGMLAYKMVNTLDSMIGYHSERYLQFGCWAARIDDVANYIPARITALMMVMASRLPHPGTSTGMGLWQQARFVLKYGPQHASPNSGWPEAALASVLDCRFGGAHDYFGQRFEKPYIGHHQRPFGMDDMRCATALNTMVEVMCVLLCLGVTLMRQ